jgi:hypothetical protein
MTPPRSFGVFAPVGYLVLAFQEEREAAEAREALLTGGYDDEEVMQFSSQQVISATENERDVSILAYLGTELAHQREQLEYARQGCTFLVVYAPTEAETARVLKVARRYGARLAHKYNRLTVEEVPMGGVASRKAS